MHTEAKRPLKKILVVLGVASLLLVGTVEFFGAGAREYAWLVRVLPSPLRLGYLNRVFDTPDGDCEICYARIAGALDALQEAQESHVDYGFDYVRLLPLLKRSELEFREPIPQLSCHLILVQRDERVLKAMAQAFKADAASLEPCVGRRAGMLKSYRPADYELTRAALLKVPELAVYVEQAN